MPQNDYLAKLRDAFGPMVEQGLQQSAATMANPFLMFPNQGFWGNHPRLTHGIEGALLSASRPYQGETPGDAISYVASGLVGLPEAREQLRMRRAMAPLAAMQPMLDLYKMDREMQEFSLDKQYKESLMAESGARTTRMNNPTPDYRDAGYSSTGHKLLFDNNTGKVVDTGFVGAEPKWNPRPIARAGTWAERRALMLEQADDYEVAGDKEMAAALRQRVQRQEQGVSLQAGLTGGAGARSRLQAGLDLGTDIPEVDKQHLADQKSAISQRLKEMETRIDIYTASLFPDEPANKETLKPYRLLQRIQASLSGILRQNPGMNLDQMIEAAQQGKLNFSGPAAVAAPPASKPSSTGGTFTYEDMLSEWQKKQAKSKKR